MTLAKTARLQADRAVTKIVRDFDPAFDLDDYLVNASYEEANARIPQPDTFEETPRGNRAYDRWMDWRETVEQEARERIQERYPGLGREPDGLLTVPGFGTTSY